MLLLLEGSFTHVLKHSQGNKASIHVQGTLRNGGAEYFSEPYLRRLTISGVRSHLVLGRREGQSLQSEASTCASGC